MKLQQVILRDTRANQPTAAAGNEGWIYFVTDESVLERSSGSAWESISPTGGGGGGLSILPGYTFSRSYIGLTDSITNGAYQEMDQSLEPDTVWAADDSTYAVPADWETPLGLTQPADGTESHFTLTEDGTYLISYFAIFGDSGQDAFCEGFITNNVSAYADAYNFQPNGLGALGLAVAGSSQVSGKVGDVIEIKFKKYSATSFTTSLYVEATITKIG